jgi:hypothetical protein
MRRDVPHVLLLLRRRLRIYLLRVVQLLLHPGRQRRGLRRGERFCQRDDLWRLRHGGRRDRRRHRVLRDLRGRRLLLLGETLEQRGAEGRGRGRHGGGRGRLVVLHCGGHLGRRRRLRFWGRRLRLGSLVVVRLWMTN